MSNPYINLGIKCAQFSTGVSSNLNINKPGMGYKPAPSINTGSAQSPLKLPAGYSMQYSPQSQAAASPVSPAKPTPSINTGSNFAPKAPSLPPARPMVLGSTMSANKPSLGMSHYRADMPPDTNNPLIKSYMAANPGWTPPKQPADLTRTTATDYRKNLLSQQYGAQNVQASKDLGNPMGPSSLRGADNYARDWTKSPGHFAAQGYSSHRPWQYR